MKRNINEIEGVPELPSGLLYEVSHDTISDAYYLAVVEQRRRGPLRWFRTVAEVHISEEKEAEEALTEAAVDVFNKAMESTIYGGRKAHLSEYTGVHRETR